MAIVLDASTPARFFLSNAGAGVQNGTSASFTPPANSLLRCSASLNTNPAAAPTYSVPTNTGSGIGIWRLVKSQTNAAGGAAAIWEAQVGASPTAITVTVSISGTGFAGSVANDGSGWVDVWTGANSSQVGAATAGNTSTSTSISPTLTTTQTGSQVHGVAVDWSATGAPTSSDAISSYHTIGQTSGGRAYKAANSGAPGSVAVNFVAGGAGPQWTYVLAEILPPASADVLMSQAVF